MSDDVDIFKRYFPWKLIMCMKFRIDLLSGSGEDFFKVFIFNPIWPSDHVTDDIVNLILHSHRVVDQIPYMKFQIFQIRILIQPIMAGIPLH